MTGRDIKYLIAMGMITGVILVDMLYFGQSLNWKHLVLYVGLGLYSVSKKKTE